jgi:hypothetical protein
VALHELTPRRVIGWSILALGTRRGLLLLQGTIPGPCDVEAIRWTASLRKRRIPLYSGKRDMEQSVMLSLSLFGFLRKIPRFIEYMILVSSDTLATEECWKAKTRRYLVF